MDESMYQYEARVERIVDGDTIEFTVDLGFHLYFREQMRLAHYAAPEIKGPERPLGIIAKQKLEDLLPVGTVVNIRSHKTEKFGRWLAEVAWKDGSLSDLLIQQGYGLRYDNNRNEKNPTFDPNAAYPLITSDTHKA
jgi:micrococcal nuclease